MLQVTKKLCKLNKMKQTKHDIKRLFLFAGYDKDGIIDDSLVYYVKHLSLFGDVVLFTDCDCSAQELDKVKSYCMYASAARHGEYDFGSYKRAYLWATKNLNLQDYDFVYLVNDSVYGPFFDLGKYFQEMESWNSDAFGMVDKIGGHGPHIQSWFIGMRPSVFLSAWFDEFIKSVKHEQKKSDVAVIYETGFSRKLNAHKIPYKCIYSVRGRGVYNKVRALYNKKMPFMKKVAFIRHDGGLAGQIKYVLNHLSPELREIILKSAYRVYGADVVNGVLTRGRFANAIRKIKYALKKVIKGQI